MKSEAVLTSLDFSWPKAFSKKIKLFQSSEPTRPRIKASKCTNGQAMISFRQSLLYFQLQTTAIFITTKALLSSLKTTH